MFIQTCGGITQRHTFKYVILYAFFICCCIVARTSSNEQSPTEADLTVLTLDDFANAKEITKDEMFHKPPITLEEVNGYKSDIRSPSDQSKHKRVRRNGVNRPMKLWPHGRIPYAISSHYNTHERALLARAVKQYHDKTCVRFVPRAPGEPDYLFIGKVDGCFSEVGRTSGIQVLSLDNGCMEYSTIIHEIMHVVGFYHEHERWDRDNYIDIIWQNIDRGALDQFGKVDLSKTSYYGQPYDYKSILHYDSLAFSKNGLPTMLPRRNGFSTTIGNAKDFSEVDLTKINRMYRCDQRLPAEAVAGGPFTPLARARVAPTYQPTGYLKNADVPMNFNNFAPPPTPDQQLLPAPHPLQVNRNVYFENEIDKRPHSSSCEDKITVCWWTQDRCRSPNVYLMMKTLCPKTCRFC